MTIYSLDILLFIFETRLNTWKFMVHVLLKPGLENSEHYFTSMWDECNCAIVWAFFGIAFLRDWNENWPFPVLWHCWVFQICWHIECSTFTASQPLALRCLIVAKKMWVNVTCAFSRAGPQTSNVTLHIPALHISGQIQNSRTLGTIVSLDTDNLTP